VQDLINLYRGQVKQLAVGVVVMAVGVEVVKLTVLLTMAVVDGVVGVGEAVVVGKLVKLAELEH
jgi:hypothetical protein